MEFAEVREYAPGDDVRTIDWNVTARMDAPYVKKYVEERDLTLLLLVDLSGSQSLRLALPAQARLRGRAGRGAGLLGGGQPGPRGRGAVHRPRRGLRRAPRGPGPRAAHRARPAGAGARGPRHRPRAPPCASRAGCCAGAASWPSSPTSRTTGYERALGILRARHDVIALHLWDPGEAEIPDGRPGGPARSRDGRAARGGHVRPRRAPPAARGHADAARRRRSAGRRSTPWPSPPRSRTSGRWPPSSRRGRSGDEARSSLALVLARSRASARADEPPRAAGHAVEGPRWAWARPSPSR